MESQTVLYIIIGNFSGVLAIGLFAWTLSGYIDARVIAGTRSLARDVEDHRVLISQQRKEIDEHKESKKELERRHLVLNEQVFDFKEQIRDLKFEIRDLEKQLDRERNQHSSEKQELEAKIRDLHAQLSSFKGTVDEKLSNMKGDIGNEGGMSVSMMGQMIRQSHMFERKIRPPMSVDGLTTDTDSNSSSLTPVPHKSTVE